MTKDGGEKAPTETQQVEPQEQERHRPKKSIRHELLNGMVVAVDHAISPPEADADLMITILDDDCNFVDKQAKKNKDKRKH